MTLFIKNLIKLFRINKLLLVNYIQIASSANRKIQILEFKLQFVNEN